MRNVIKLLENTNREKNYYLNTFRIEQENFFKYWNLSTIFHYIKVRWLKKVKYHPRRWD